MFSRKYRAATACFAAVAFPTAFALLAVPALLLVALAVRTRA
ncbi:hypothetical protein [Kitasatospora phosalacinea]|uniref:Uncharacterized protein n=1 Tax=Kitasatospora phosalacinea TaxID=2065 RepID=A0A9W6PD87_9ACTN|nr:hypothetical protein [Kitasatospora phosalacinea]GLW52971.1 hypothetical protein Kpho01_09820 [Kitasatospora phosalacinea]